MTISGAFNAVGKSAFVRILPLLDHAKLTSHLPACVPIVVVPEHVSTSNVVLIPPSFVVSLSFLLTLNVVPVTDCAPIITSVK